MATFLWLLSSCMIVNQASWIPSNLFATSATSELNQRLATEIEKRELMEMEFVKLKEQHDRAIADKNQELDEMKKSKLQRRITKKAEELERLTIDYEENVNRLKLDHQKEKDQLVIEHRKLMRSAEQQEQELKNVRREAFERSEEVQRGTIERERMEEIHQNVVEELRSEAQGVHKQLTDKAEAMERTHKTEMDAALRSQEERLRNDHEKELERVQQNRILIGRQLFTLQGQVEELQETNRRLAAESVSLKDELQGMKSAHEAGTGVLNDGHEAVVTSMQSVLDVVTQRLAVRDGELADRDDELAVLNRALTEEIANSERRKSEVEELEKEKSEWDNKVKEEHERFLICIVVIVVLVVAILSGFGAFVARWCCKLGKNIAEKGIDGKMPKMKLSLASKLKADIP